jgi:lipoprotein-releasing system permease protein
MRAIRISMMLAWRNLWRNHRRTIIMLAAISIGAWAMIFMTAIMRGMVNDMLRDGIRSLPGHIQVHHLAYRNDPAVSNLVSMSGARLNKVFTTAGIERFAARVRVPAVISSERESRSVTLVGVDPLQEISIAAVGSEVAEGRRLNGVTDKGVIIGRGLADKLDTGIGKRVVLMSQNPANEVADRGFRVIGLYEAKLAAQEEAFAFSGRQTVQKMLDIGDGVSEVAVAGDNFREVDLLLADVRQLMNGRDEVLSWQELDPYLGSMLSVMDGFVLVWVIVIFLALSFGLVNTLVMAVFERVREIGLMLALGIRPSGILLQIFFESTLLLVIGLAIGNVLAIASVVPLQGGIDISSVAKGMEMFGASGVLYPEMQLDDVVLANVVVLVLGFFASISPAWRASRYEPVEAITKV